MKTKLHNLANHSIIQRTILIIVLFICFIVGNNHIVHVYASATQNEISTPEVVAKVVNSSFSTKEQIPSTLVLGMDYDYGQVSEINEFWGADGNYNIVYCGENTVYISVLNDKMVLQKTLEIAKDLSIVGDAIQDKAGNYYIAYGKNDSADMNTDASAGTAEVMSIVQYNSEGKLLSKLSYTGFDTCPYDGIGWGTKQPFDFGNCVLLIDSSGDLICRYGRVMYNGHQSSHALFVNTTTMNKLNYIAPYNSHSFDQKAIETSDGSYLYVDRGDAYERGFVVFKTDKYKRTYGRYLRLCHSILETDIFIRQLMLCLQG